MEKRHQSPPNSSVVTEAQLQKPPALNILSIYPKMLWKSYFLSDVTFKKNKKNNPNGGRGYSVPLYLESDKPGGKSYLCHLLAEGYYLWDLYICISLYTYKHLCVCLCIHLSSFRHNWRIQEFKFSG